jgi:hypothetical protein
VTSASFGSVPLTSKYDHTILFSSRTEQAAYFSERLRASRFTDLSFVRRGWALQLKRDGVATEALAWNYAMIENDGDPYPRYYFVTEVRYINSNTVELDLELDVVQTYLFDVELLPCLIERQHTESDEIGEHTVDEGLETGELVNLWQSDAEELRDLAIVYMTSLKIGLTLDGLLIKYDFEDSGTYGSMLNDVYSGLRYYMCDPEYHAQFSELLREAEVDGKIDGIVNMFMLPRAIIESDADGKVPSASNSVYAKITGVKDVDVTVAKRHEVDGYTPKNNKLLTYPYTFLSVTNNAGASAVFRYERFDSEECAFMIKGAISPDGGVRLEPKFYNGTGDNYEAGLTLTGFPSCAWDADPYKIWLAQNQNQLATEQASNLIKMATGAAMVAAAPLTGGMSAMAGVGLMGTGFLNSANQIALRKDMDVQPPQARGAYSASINAAHGKLTFSFYAKSVNAEHARRIDDFFTVYGYKLNVLGVPNRAARPCYTYVKTNGCKVAGAIQHTDAEQLEAIYDHGITFWKPSARLGDYTQNNAPN